MFAYVELACVLPLCGVGLLCVEWFTFAEPAVVFAPVEPFVRAEGGRSACDVCGFVPPVAALALVAVSGRFGFTCAAFAETGLAATTPGPENAPGLAVAATEGAP